MILATWQQERAAVTWLFSEETALICQLPESHLGRTRYSGNPVGRVHMNICEGKLLYTVFNEFASALHRGWNQQTWDAIMTAFGKKL